MSKETQFSKTQINLRSLYLHSRQTTSALEKLLRELAEYQDENLQIAIDDAKNVMKVLVHRTAESLRIA